MKKEIPVKQHGAACIPSPFSLSSKSNHENFHIVKDDACILHDATECSKGNVKNKFLLNSQNRIQAVFLIYQKSGL
jgi:hypothetical protein